MAGDDWQKFANLRAYYGFMWGYPGKKLLFMGQEFAQRARMERGARRSTGTCSTSPPHEGVQPPGARPQPALPRHARRCMQRDCEAEGFDWLIVDDTRELGLRLAAQGAGRSRRSRSISNFTPVPRDGYRRAAAAGRRAGARSSTPTPPSTAARGMGNLGGVDAERRRRTASAHADAAAARDDHAGTAIAN